MAIITARPYNVKAVSDFAVDAYAAANMIANENKEICFTKFATNSILVETKNILAYFIYILNKKLNYIGSVHNEHNIKNYHYQYW